MLSADILPPPSYELEFLEDGQPEIEHEGDGATLHYTKAKVLENRRLTADDHFQDVRHLAFDLKGSSIRLVAFVCLSLRWMNCAGTDNVNSYNAGDVMVVRPCNLPDEVQEVINFFHWEAIADKPFRLVPTREGKA